MDIDMEKRRSELIEWFEAALRTPSIKLTQYFDESGMYGISLSLKPELPVDDAFKARRVSQA